MVLRRLKGGLIGVMDGKEIKQSANCGVVMLDRA
jgi:hypothetical protein